MKKLLIALIFICSAILVVGAQTGFAYQTYESGCQACHGSGFSSPLHTIHTGQACTICHPGAAGAKPIPTSSCAGCHPAADPGLCPLINAPAHAGIKTTCLGCHTSCTSSQPPANDDFDNATAITVLPFLDRINTSGATSAADDPTDCYGTDASVWYELTSITDIRIQVGAVSADYNTVVAVYTGTRGNLNLVACRDSPPCFTLDVQAGETYYVMVTSYYGMGGDLVFGVDEAPPPPPPLTIDLKVDPVNFVNNGITTVSGTVNSSIPADVQVYAQVRQKAGRVFITGYSYAYIYTADGRWTMEVPGDIGPFLPGKATVRAIAEGCYYDPCSYYSNCAQTPEVSMTVRLQRAKR